MRRDAPPRREAELACPRDEDVRGEDAVRGREGRGQGYDRQGAAEDERDRPSARRPPAHGVVMKATRVVLIAAGVVGVVVVAKKYLSPGVYVEEVPSTPRPIGTVGTSTAGFVGSDPEKP